MSSCTKEGQDVGGGSNACGYMPIIKIIDETGAAPLDWYSGFTSYVSAAELDTPQKCQALCEQTAGCKYWYYDAPDPTADCTLKAGYPVSDIACEPLYEDTADGKGFAGPKVCPECHHKDMDVGGGSNECGYMPVVAIIGAPGQEHPGDWFTGHFRLTDSASEMDAPHKCKALCEANADCQYWYWSPPDPAADCTLKAGYPASKTCEPLYEASSEEGSQAGPKWCSVAASSTTCGALKAFYSTNECCGQASKMIPKPY